MSKFLNKTLFGVLSILIIMSTPAYAINNGISNGSFNQAIMKPYFTYISTFHNAFDIDSYGKTSVSVYLTARNVDSVKVDAYLQQYKDGSWMTIKSWTSTSAGTNSGLGGTYYVAKGYSYRLVSTGYVYEGGVSMENSTFISETKNY